MSEGIELLARREGARTQLAAPEVGLFHCALKRGALVGAGTVVGVLEQLGVRRKLVVPAGVEGRVASDPPARALAPVGYGEVLLEIETLAGVAGLQNAPAAAAGAAGAACVRAPSSGRFWHRPAPGEPPLVSAGMRIEDGQSIGLLEVMKTFSAVRFRAAPGLPSPARVARVIAADGADVREGDVLIELERAS